MPINYVKIKFEVKAMRFFKSKKGFTLVEIMIVVIVMGILVAVAVPVYNVTLERQKKSDCNNNRIVISNVLAEATNGMFDNGKKQSSMNMALFEATHKTLSSQDFPEGYQNRECFVLTYDEETGADLGDIRGGYRDGGSYELGCEIGHYLKRKDLEDVKFYTFLANNGEIPVCPYCEDDGVNYQYYIFDDGTVICSRPGCQVTEE